MYYSILTLTSQPWSLATTSQLIPYKIISGLFLGVIFVYFFLRMFVNRIAGIYTAKRIAFGTILAYLSISGGIDQNLGNAFLCFMLS